MRAQSELVHIAEREVSRTKFNKPIKRAQKVQLPYTEGTVLTVYFLVPVGGPPGRSWRGMKSE